MWLLYVGVPRLGGGWALLISVVTICRGSKTWWREGIIDQCGYYMSGFQDLVEGALLISVVTICRGSKTWWRAGIIDQ